jgi:hypothetical protein
VLFELDLRAIFVSHIVLIGLDLRAVFVPQIVLFELDLRAIFVPRIVLFELDLRAIFVPQIVLFELDLRAIFVPQIVLCELGLRAIFVRAVTGFWQYNCQKKRQNKGKTLFSFFSQLARPSPHSRPGNSRRDVWHQGPVARVGARHTTRCR